MALTSLRIILLTSLSEGFRVENTLSPATISLYDNSEVVNIYDDNVYNLYNSDTLWLVQFYNHWCGHCQRFAPIWKALAEDILDWAPIVKIAAINCADQSCDRYQAGAGQSPDCHLTMFRSRALPPSEYFTLTPTPMSSTLHTTASKSRSKMTKITFLILFFTTSLWWKLRPANLV